MSDLQERFVDHSSVRSAFGLRMLRKRAETTSDGDRLGPFGHASVAVAPPVAALRTLIGHLVARNRHLAELLLQQQTRSTNLLNILSSMDRTTLYLSGDLKLRYFSETAGLLFGLALSDIGTSLERAASLAASVELIADIAAVARTGAPCEREALLPDGRMHLCRVLPVLTSDARPDGVVILVTAIGEALRDGPRPTKPSCRWDLTPRQRQIMDRVLAGELSKNIAADLNISQRTVENHRAEIMRRTGATSLPALARMAIGASSHADRRAEGRG